jgi:hypothetical protein
MAIPSWLATIGKGTQQSQVQTSGYAPPNDVELAIAIALSPGNYTAILSGKEQRYRQRFDRSVRVELIAPVKPKGGGRPRRRRPKYLGHDSACPRARNLFERGAKAALAVV